MSMKRCILWQVWSLVPSSQVANGAKKRRPGGYVGRTPDTGHCSFLGAIFGSDIQQHRDLLHPDVLEQEEVGRRRPAPRPGNQWQRTTLRHGGQYGYNVPALPPGVLRVQCSGVVLLKFLKQWSTYFFFSYVRVLCKSQGFLNIFVPAYIGVTVEFTNVPASILVDFNQYLYHLYQDVYTRQMWGSLCFR